MIHTPIKSDYNSIYPKKWLCTFPISDSAWKSAISGTWNIATSNVRNIIIENIIPNEPYTN